MDATPVALAAALMAGGIGELQRRRLNALTYRHPDETHLPKPGPRWRVPDTLTLAVGLLVWRYIATGQADHLTHLLPVAVAGTWLAAGDLDVHRLPYRTTAGATLIAGAGVAAVALLRTDITIAVAAALGGALSYGAFRLLNTLSRGGMGMGDARLAGLIGLTTAAVSPWTTWWAFAVATGVSAVWALIRRLADRRVPFGPWLLTGWFAALMIA